jgi:hypothetical protein
MPDARIIAATIAAAALAGCQKQPQQEQNIVITNEIPGNADIETLPPDEGNGTTDNNVVNDFNSV